MKQLFFLALVFLLAGCSNVKLQPTSYTWDFQSTGQGKWATITQLSLFQVILEESNSTYTWSKMMIGCNDSLINFPVKTSIPEENKYAGLRDLLTQYDAKDKWFFNPWKLQDKISFFSYEINGATLTINLKGDLKLGGVCDIPRLNEVVKATYRNFWFEDVVIMINGKNLNTMQ